jgi:sulfate adenylyltransferase (ADP) / ATP adenylyltransferase
VQEIFTVPRSELSSNLLPVGSLWHCITQQTTAAIACGALLSIPTQDERLEQGGLNFVVRVSRNMTRKQTANSQTGRQQNPFLPYETDLFVADLAPAHVALLNKFNVVKHHLLIITRHFEPQEDWLTHNDFVALAQCMAQINGLAFYNGGQQAGASQGHKHLQIIPLPISSDHQTEVPLEALMDAAFDADTLAPLPFIHSISSLALDWSLDPETVATALYQHYRHLYRSTGLPTYEQPQPYNLLLTRRWMLLVPRSQESYAGISVNALGFAGSLFVRDHAQLEQLREIGPMTVLEQVALPRSV